MMDQQPTENLANKRAKTCANDVYENIEASSFRCLEALVKLILSSERKATHNENQIDILTALGEHLLTTENRELLQHSNLLSHVGFLAQEKQVSNELILRDLKNKYSI